MALSAITGCKKDGKAAGNPSGSPRTEVPDEITGAWEHGSIDFDFWENYQEGYYAGRNAVPTREAMIFGKNGDAKFYRYEFGFGMYEKLVDCTGTVTFNENGTFTFYPLSGRKRYIDSRHSPNSFDRPLNQAELNDPEIAGTRGYTYMGDSDPAVLRITVPGSAPYNWYKKF